MIRFSNTRPGVRLCWLIVAGSRSRPTRRSTWPSVPNDVIALAGLRVDLLQHVAGAEDQAAIAAVRALPVVHAADVEAVDAGVRPQLACRWRHRARRTQSLGAAAVDDAAHDERVEVGLAGRVGPGDLQLADVGLGDLRRRDEPRAVGPAGVVAPFARASGRRATAPRRRPAESASVTRPLPPGWCRCPDRILNIDPPPVCRLDWRVQGDSIDRRDQVQGSKFRVQRSRVRQRRGWGWEGTANVEVGALTRRAGTVAGPSCFQRVGASLTDCPRCYVA